MDDGTRAAPWEPVGRERFERLVETLGSSTQRRAGRCPWRSMAAVATGVVTSRSRSTDG